ncbi:hypothetical protein LCGC14_2280290, partial [marine sediment metagenome]
MEYDIHNHVKVRTGIAPVAALGADTDSAVIDTVGFESFEWLIAMGVITTGTFSLVFEESDVVTFGGEETLVPAANLLGASPTYIATDDGQVRRIGVTGKKRFQRCTLVGASTPVATGAVLALLGNPKTVPVGAQATAEV